MARTSISIPDDLKTAITPYKDRINFSAICSAALWKAVEAERLREEYSHGLSEAVSRLRSQRLASDEASAKRGYHDGATWILRDGDYADIKWFTNELAPRVEEGGRACDVVSEERSDLEAQQTQLMDALAEERDPHEYWAGFLQAVLDIWAQIEDAVDGDDVR